MMGRECIGTSCGSQAKMAQGLNFRTVVKIRSYYRNRPAGGNRNPPIYLFKPAILTYFFYVLRFTSLPLHELSSIKETRWESHPISS